MTNSNLIQTENWKKTSCRDIWLNRMSLLSTSMHVRPRTWRTLDRQIITYISSMFFLFEWTSLRRESAQTLHYLSWFTSLTQVKFQGRCPSPSRNNETNRNQQLNSNTFQLSGRKHHKKHQTCTTSIEESSMLLRPPSCILSKPRWGKVMISNRWAPRLFGRPPYKTNWKWRLNYSNLPLCGRNCKQSGQRYFKIRFCQ